jgi:hypothetical protein
MAIGTSFFASYLTLTRYVRQALRVCFQIPPVGDTVLRTITFLDAALREIYRPPAECARARQRQQDRLNAECKATSHKDYYILVSL